MNSNENLTNDFESLRSEMKNNPEQPYCLINTSKMGERYFSSITGGLYGSDFLSMAKSTGEGYFWAPKYAIIDNDGNLRIRNNNFINVSKDANGYVHVLENGKEVYLIKLNPNAKERGEKFISAKNYRELVDLINKAFSMGLLRELPEGFSLNGFEKPPINIKEEQQEESTLGN